MKAALIHTYGAAPVYADFRDPPSGTEGSANVAVTASALSHVTKSRASGQHYSASGTWPLVPGIDGTGRLDDGTRVYFILPEAPFGGMAAQCVVDRKRCIRLPDALDDVTAAAIAIPGMSSWAALVERARLVQGETVLVNGATGISGSLAVQIAKRLGAGKIIATGRDETTLAHLRHLGADVTIALVQAPQALDAAFQTQFREGIDIVLDYLWGTSAEMLLAAGTRAAPDAVPIRFIQIGAVSGSTITLPSAALRSSSIELKGSGIGSIPMPRLFDAINNVFEAAMPAGFHIKTQPVPLAAVADYWDVQDSRRRIVFTMHDAA